MEFQSGEYAAQGSSSTPVPCRAFDPTARFETHRSRSFHTSSNLKKRSRGKKRMSSADDMTATVTVW
jgi:hypothetical protein